MKERVSKSKGDLSRFDHDRRILLVQTRKLVKLSATELKRYWARFPKQRLLRYYMYGKLRPVDMRIVEALNERGHFGNDELNYHGREAEFDIGDFVRLSKSASKYMYNHKKPRKGTIIRVVFYDKRYYYHVQDLTGKIHGATKTNLIKL